MPNCQVSHSSNLPAMWNSVHGWFKRIPCNTSEAIEGQMGRYLTFGDRLKKKLKKGDSRTTRPVVSHEQEKREVEKRSCCSMVEERRTIRMRVKMTKEEATRLMSKCKEGGTLGIKDVADELVQIPASRFSFVPSAGAYGGVLETIPEEI